MGVGGGGNIDVALVVVSTFKKSKHELLHNVSYDRFVLNANGKDGIDGI